MEGKAETVMEQMKILNMDFGRESNDRNLLI
jgi:hypothetical protein